MMDRPRLRSELHVSVNHVAQDCRSPLVPCESLPTRALEVVQAGITSEFPAPSSDVVRLCSPPLVSMDGTNESLVDDMSRTMAAGYVQSALPTHSVQAVDFVGG
jgi:hypothetical protein